MTNLWHRITSPWRQSGPSEEAKRTHGKADEIVARANRVYGERDRLLRENHFAERIRLSYERRA
jgi:hypothetical protein